MGGDCLLSEVVGGDCICMLIQTVGAGRGQRVAFLDQSTRVFYVDFDNLLRQRVHWLGRNTDSEPESQIR